MDVCNDRKGLPTKAFLPWKENSLEVMTFLPDWRMYLYICVGYITAVDLNMKSISVSLSSSEQSWSQGIKAAVPLPLLIESWAVLRGFQMKK